MIPEGVSVPMPASAKPRHSLTLFSGTKKLSRFHTPEVLRLITERDQHREALAAACDKTFKDLLAAISADYQPLRDACQTSRWLKQRCVTGVGTCISMSAPACLSNAEDDNNHSLPTGILHVL